MPERFLGRLIEINVDYLAASKGYPIEGHNPRMSLHYTVRTLPADRVDQAFTVAGPADADLDLDAWRTICRSALSSDGEFSDAPTIFIAEGPRGHVHGICFVAAPNLEQAAHVSTLLVLRALDSEAVATELLRSVAQWCRARDCNTLSIAAPREDRAIRDAIMTAKDRLSPELGGLNIIFR